MNRSASLKMQPDDPRLTAFALGELEGDEQARVAAAVAGDPSLQAAVDEITSAVSQLTAALAAEPIPDVEPIELPEPSRIALPRRTAQPAARARLIQFPYVAIGSLAAACFAIVFLMLSQNERAAQQAANRAEVAGSADSAPITLAANPTPAPAVPGTRIPDTLPPAEAAPRASTPPIAPVPAPVDAPADHVAVAVSPMIPTSPNATPVTVFQTDVASSPALAGLDHDPQNRGVPVALPAPSPAPLLTQARRTFVREAPLPPSAAAPRAGSTGGNDTGYFDDLLVEGSTPGDHLRMTFREFGTRYTSNRNETRARGIDDSGRSVAVASGEAGTSRRVDDAVAVVNETAARVPAENPKTDAPAVARLPYEAPVTGSTLQDEFNDRGTILEGHVAELDTQLRELEGSDGATESLVHDFVRDNAFMPAAEHPASVFPVVTDSGSHIHVRRALLAGAWPSRETVRIEELLQAQTFNYAAPPVSGEGGLFGASLEVASAPWAPEHRLVRVGLKARAIAPEARPAGHFVVLVETGNASSGGGAASQLPLIKATLREFVEQLGPQDEIALAQHSGAASLLLPSTSARDRELIFAAIEQLQGGTAASGITGLQLAYDVARSHFAAHGINRVLFISEGDTRLGEARRDDALRLIATQAQIGIALSAVGVGVREIRDSMFEQLAHSGAGDVAFVDTARDATRVLRERAAANAFATVARDVKLQVEFNPARVHSWRLIGYEDRVFLREDFDPESLAAESVGAGHTVTALFEIVPATPPAPSVDDTVAVDGELLSVKVRSTATGEQVARVQQFALTDAGRAFEEASADFRFATAIAGFGMLLRESPYRGTTTFADVAAWARAGAGAAIDSSGARAELLDMIDRASRLVR